MEQEPKKEQLEKSKLECIHEPDTEVNLFFRNISNNPRKSHIDMIFKTLPELADIKNSPDNLSDEEKRNKVEVAINAFREKYAENIKIAEENINAELPKINEGIKFLEDLMGETEHFKYLVMPSIYPICPFDKNRKLFFFSITGVSAGKTVFSRLPSTALHEISHFIFFDQIKFIPNTLSDIGVHHLKEVLTPVLLQHPDILKFREGNYIIGNDESVKYQVDYNGKIMSIFDFVNQEYQKNPTTEGYITFLHWLIRLFEKIEPEVIKRNELFNKNGKETFKNSELKAKFMEPIKI